MQIQLVDNVLKAEDFVRLRRETGFADIPVEHAKKLWLTALSMFPRTAGINS